MRSSAWILFQLVSALLDPQGNVGWWAHLGGLAAGAALTPLFIQRGVTAVWPRRPPMSPAVGDGGRRLWRR